MAMDQLLADRLNNLNKQNSTLTAARGAYLLKEAERKHFEARLVSVSEGKSHAERTIKAHAMAEWLEFQKQLAALETAFEYEKLRYDILDKAFQAEYLSAKLDADTIKRQVGT